MTYSEIAQHESVADQPGMMSVSIRTPGILVLANKAIIEIVTQTSETSTRAVEDDDCESGRTEENVNSVQSQTVSIISTIDTSSSSVPFVGDSLPILLSVKPPVKPPCDLQVPALRNTQFALLAELRGAPVFPCKLTPSKSNTR